MRPKKIRVVLGGSRGERSLAVVSVAFMEVRRGPETIRLCAVAGLLWLCILLGLGSLDPMTRVNYYVQTTNLQ